MTTLDDASAIHILKTIAQARLRSSGPEAVPASDVRAALETVGDTPATATSEGDLARAALELLAQDPVFAGPIQVMSRQPPAGRQQYIDPTAIALTTAAILALQTRVKIKRGSDGKWSIEIEKKASGDGPVKLLVQRLLALLPAG